MATRQAQKKDKWSWLNGIGAFVFLSMIVFVLNPPQLLAYTLVLFLVWFLWRWRAQGRRPVITAWSTGMPLASIYLVMIVVYSISPLVQQAEFRMTHPGWTNAAASLTGYTTGYHIGYRSSNSYAYADASYRYQAAGVPYTATAAQQARNYRWFWIDPEPLRVQSGKRVARAMQQHDYTVYYNRQRPSESRLFLTADLVYFNGSGLKNFAGPLLFVLGGVILCLIPAWLLQGKAKR